MRGKSRLVALTLGLLLLAACGGDGKGPKAKLEPCGLITQAEAEAALGRPVKPGQGKDTGNPLGQIICSYGLAAEDAVGYVQISLIRNQGMEPRLHENGYNALRLARDTREHLAGVKEVPGLGQEAFTWGGDGPRSAVNLAVVDKEAYLHLTVSGLETAKNLEAAKDLARKALARLP